MSGITFLLLILLVLSWLFFCLFSGNYYFTLSGIMAVPFFCLLYAREFDYRLLPLMILPCLSLGLINILAWRENSFKPKGWKRLEYVLGIVAVLLILFVYLIPLYAFTDKGLGSYLLTSIFFLTLSFFIGKLFIGGLLYAIINRFKTATTTTVSGFLGQTYAVVEGRSPVYFIQMNNEAERIRINLILRLYLNSKAKGKNVSFEFKRGWLGFEYCTRFPKIIA